MLLLSRSNLALPRRAVRPRVRTTPLRGRNSPSPASAVVAAPGPSAHSDGMITRVSLVLVVALGVLGLAVAQGPGIQPVSRTGLADAGVRADGGVRDAGTARTRARVVRPRADARSGADAGPAANAEGVETDGGAPDAGGSAGLEARLAELEARVTALEQAQTNFQTALDTANQKIADLEQAQGVTESRREARTPRFDRAALLGGILQDLEGVEKALSEGSGDGASGTLNRDVTALGEVSTEASRLGRVLEAKHCDDAGGFLQEAVSALGQSDLYRARVLVANAMVHTRRALSLAQTVTNQR